MMAPLRFTGRGLMAALTAGLLLTACATTPETNYYLLLPQAEASRSAAVDLPVTIGVGPIELAPYLDRPQIVTRQEGSELTFAEFHRWAEPLEDNLTGLVAENLVVLLNPAAVERFPWPAGVRPDYRVRLAVDRFDAEEAGRVVLATRWRIVDEQSGQQLMRQRSTVEVAVAPPPWDYGALTFAMSQALAELSRDIAAALQRQIPSNSAPSLNRG